MSWAAEDDGKTHINIYTKGNTPLGRFLSNLSLAPFTHPEHGSFACVEGYWYWLGTGMQHEMLREMLGFEAKAHGKKLEKVPMEPEVFEKCIKEAITAKLRANPEMLNTLIDSTLPLAHYYVYYGKVVEAGYEWLVEYHEHIRQSCQEKGWRAKV